MMESFDFREYKAAFFDIDGVLIDSESVYISCWIEAAQQYGCQISTDQALQLRSLDHADARKLFIEWFDDAYIYGYIRSLRKKIMEEKLKREPLRLKKGVKEILKVCKREGIYAVAVTSSPYKNAVENLIHVGLQEYLQDIISCGNCLRGKPYPDIYLFACQKINICPSEIVVFEDSPNGIKSAAAAGCAVVMIEDLSIYTEELSPYIYAYYENFEKFLQIQNLDRSLQII